MTPSPETLEQIAAQHPYAVLLLTSLPGMTNFLEIIYKILRTIMPPIVRGGQVLAEAVKYLARGRGKNG